MFYTPSHIHTFFLYYSSCLTLLLHYSPIVGFINISFCQKYKERKFVIMFSFSSTHVYKNDTYNRQICYGLENLESHKILSHIWENWFFKCLLVSPNSNIFVLMTSKLLISSSCEHVFHVRLNKKNLIV